MARIENWNPPKIPNLSARYQWGGAKAPYAPQVFFGYTSLSDLEVPGRDWVSVAQSNLDIFETFVSHFTTVTALRAAFEMTAMDFGEALKGAIKGDYYSWPRRTRRRSGERVGSPRNIVDLGNLLESQTGPEFSP